MADARNIRNLSMQQTPLLGEENTPLRELVGRGGGFEGATPRGVVAATPNPLATPLRSMQSDGSQTPASSVGGRPGATPLRTPMRDSLSINDDASSVGDTPRQRLHELKSQLKQGFLSLPKAKNEFELVLPEDDEELADDEVSVAMRIEDATEREEKLAAIKAVEDAKALARRSQVVRRGLPRPVNFDATSFLDSLDSVRADNDDSADAAQSEAERLVAIEMVLLLQHDAITYPVPGGRRAGGGQSTLAFIDDAELTAARQAVHAEIANAVGLPGATPAQLQRTVALDSEAFDKIWRPSYESMAYDARSSRYVSVESLSEEDRIAGLAALLDLNRDEMKKESSKASKVEKKLGVTLGGYLARSKVLGTKLTEAYDELARSRIELASFERLASNEEGALERRMGSLKEEVQVLERKEREGQGRFRELSDIKAMLERECEEMEMEEAERLNDAAMDE
jgi:pre-mRNA-splicing factor CDC5/CEF1